MTYRWDSLEHDLRLAAQAGDNARITDLLDRGADLNIAPTHGLTALMLAVKEGHVETARLLLQRGARVNVRNGRGRAAFDYIDYIDCPEMVALLIENGSDFRHGESLTREITADWLVRKIEPNDIDLPDDSDEDAMLSYIARWRNTAPILAQDELWYFSTPIEMNALSGRSGFVVCHQGVPIKIALVTSIG